MAKEKILLIDEEIQTTNLIKNYLLKEGFTVYISENGQKALEIIEAKNPDLAILDIMLPDIDGIELCLEIRKRSNIPILFLSYKSEEIDKILALSVGGDDYITKPFLCGELIARIKAHLRRNRFLNFCKDTSSIIKYPGISINLDTREVWVNNELINLSNKEFEILSILVKNPKRIYSMEQLFQMVWKMDYFEGDARTIMVYISNLRKKIERDPSKPEYILNVRGVGYKFNHTILEKNSINL